MTATATWLVGGLGAPHDTFAAAAFRSLGQDACDVGPLDDDALERGRALLPRGQCAPALYTTGALVRAAGQRRGERLVYLSAHSCGPCRYALFETNWARALSRAGLPGVELRALPQSLAALEGEGGAALSVAVDALLAADVLVESVRRLGPRVSEAGALDLRVAQVTSRITTAIASGTPPREALARERGWHRDLALRPPAPHARVALVGDPWSLHVEGDGQLNLARLLRAAGVEVDAPPFALWLLYLAWQARQPGWGPTSDPTPLTCAVATSIERRIRASLAESAQAAGLEGFDVPSVDALAALAAPYLPSSFRGGYGNLEIGLALRAARERRAHLVISVKSFGCIPSGVVSDEIVPTALARELPFLALEVCGDGAAARESRIALAVGAAIERAESELEAACREHGVPRADAVRGLAPDPVGAVSPQRRRFACTLACQVGERRLRLAQGARA